MLWIGFTRINKICMIDKIKENSNAEDHTVFVVRQ